MRKLNSIHYGGTWIAVGIILGLVLPAVIWIVFHLLLFWLVLIGLLVLAAFGILFMVEMRQDFGKVPFFEKDLSRSIPYDPTRHEAVIRSSICTGERIAGFKDIETGHFTEVMLIRNAEEEARFMQIYGLEAVRIEY